MKKILFISVFLIGLLTYGQNEITLSPNTDRQKVTTFGLNGNNLEFQIENDILRSVDLSPIASSSFPAEIGVACSDEISDLSTGLKVTFRMPYAMTLTEIRANVNEAPTGSTLEVDVQETGVTLFSTLLTIDNGEETSETSATAAMLSDTALADDAEITVIINQVGSTTTGKGLKLWLIGTRSL